MVRNRRHASSSFNGQANKVAVSAVTPIDGLEIIRKKMRSYYSNYSDRLAVNDKVIHKMLIKEPNNLRNGLNPADFEVGTFIACYQFKVQIQRRIFKQ